MQEFFKEVKRTLVHLAVWGGLVVGAMYFSGAVVLISGFMLGLGTSVIYYLLMSYRVKKSAELPAAKAISYMRVGGLGRLVFVIIMLFLAAKMRQINLWSAVAGIFSLHAVMVLNAALLIIKDTNGGVQTRGKE
ncbi:hypothetical protein SDC9_116040 [bioreactor metagenome]|uniref:ATP synthase subunit I n=1 Tax=bioreactor metagenome TaxID=1076179 RepID=A0A645BUK1_9ZZZZ